MNEERKNRLKFIIDGFRVDLALDFSECKDFVFVVYFASYLVVGKKLSASLGERASLTLDKYLYGGGSYSDLKAVVEELDFCLDREYFLADVLAGFEGRFVSGRSDEVVRVFCRRIYEMLSDDQFCLFVGDYFEYVIQVLSESAGKRAGESYTPRSLVEMMVNIVQPAAGETIYDPVCGSGGFLIAASQYVLKHGGEKQVNLIGREINLSAARLAKINCYLHGCVEFRLRVESSLQFLESGTCDVVLANPPFSMPLPEVVNVDAFEFGEPPRSNADYAFLQVVVRALKKSGRAAVIVPHGVLFRGGSEGDIRRSMILAGLVDAVISLPGGMLVNTNIPTAILVLRGSAKKSNEILFVDSEAAYKALKKIGVDINGIEEAALNIYREPREVDGVSKLVSISSIEANGFSLSLARYVYPVREEGKPFRELLARQYSLDSDLDRLNKEYYALLAEIEQGDNKGQTTVSLE